MRGTDSLLDHLDQACKRPLSNMVGYLPVVSGDELRFGKTAQHGLCMGVELRERLRPGFDGSRRVGDSLFVLARYRLAQSRFADVDSQLLVQLVQHLRHRGLLRLVLFGQRRHHLECPQGHRWFAWQRADDPVVACNRLRNRGAIAFIDHDRIARRKDESLPKQSANEALWHSNTWVGVLLPIQKHSAFVSQSYCGTNTDLSVVERPRLPYPLWFESKQGKRASPPPVLLTCTRICLVALLGSGCIQMRS